MQLLLEVSTVSEWLTRDVNSPADVVLSPLSHEMFPVFSFKSKIF